MFDVKVIRDDRAVFDAGWAARGLATSPVDEILAADEAVRAAKAAFETAQAARNEKSKLIGAAKKAGDDARAATLMAEVEALKVDLPRLTEAEKLAAEALRTLLAAIPNIPAADVPLGADESGNREVRRWGEPPTLSSPKDHVDLGEALGMMDFEAAARMSGARFVVLKRDLARLERALGQFMLDLQTTEHGYEEVSPPVLVREQALFGTSQIPKFSADIFRVGSFRDDIASLRELQMESWWSDTSQAYEPGDARNRSKEQVVNDYNARLVTLLEKSIDDYKIGLRPNSFFLIPTAEVSLTNLIREQITSEEALPLRFTALTPCFRAEAGASGRDTRGMIRQHQFTKCELVSVTTPEASADEHERMTQCAEAVLKRLGLPYRTMLLCAGDMGFSARKTYDLEVWLPSQGTYREISSCSNCGDFQARRMDARIKKAGEKGTRFPHTLNGSGLAVGRTLVAVMENYQDEGGRVAIPDALQPYMRGQTHIGAQP